MQRSLLTAAYDNSQDSHDQPQRQQQQQHDGTSSAHALQEINEQADARLAAMTRIEGDLMDLNVISQSLATVVSTQGKTLNSIEEHMSCAADQTKKGTEQLVKAKKYQKKARGKMCRFLGIAVVVLVVLVIIVCA